MAGDDLPNRTAKQIVADLAHELSLDSQLVKSQTGVGDRSSRSHVSRTDFHQLSG